MWNDNGVPIGGAKVRIYAPSGADASGSTQWPTDKGVYILESWSPTRGQQVNRRYNENRAPNGANATDDFHEASGVLQLAYSTTDPVDPGYAFGLKRRGTTGQAATAESWVIISADEPEEAGGIRKQSIRCQKLYGSTGPTGAAT